MYSKNRFTLLLLISSVTTWSFAALGDVANDRKIVTSKAYVDTKQVKIPATTNTYTYDETNRPTADGSVVTTGATDGTVGERGIATAPTYDTNNNLTNDSWLPTMGAVMTAISSHTPTGTQNTIANYGANGALGSGIATYDGSGTYNAGTDAGKIATAAAVETKQDKITTGLVEFNDDPDYMLPAITTYDSTSGLVANKIGILDWQTADDVGGFLQNFSYEGGGYGSEMDNYVPTVRAVAESLSDLNNTKQGKLFVAWTSTTNPYNMASMGGETIDLTTTPGVVGHRYITAGGSQPLTQKSSADNVILYINGTKTLAQYQTSNFGGTGDGATRNQNYINGALVSLELLKDVYSALHNEIQNATPTGTAGNVAMYDATTGALSNGVATYSGATAQTPYNAGTDAGKIATAAAVETKVSKTQSTGYQVLTTGTTGTVTADYISVPVTTSGTGRPTSINAPTGAAAIWIE